MEWRLHGGELEHPSRERRCPYSAHFIDSNVVAQSYGIASSMGIVLYGHRPGIYDADTLKGASPQFPCHVVLNYLIESGKILALSCHCDNLCPWALLWMRHQQQAMAPCAYP